MAIRLSSLSDYQQVIKALPRPSSEQIDNYVWYVSLAHSWYKHLPLLPPGVMFRFFLDPFSGYDTVCQPGGRIIHKERTETSERFHYTWMTTKEYRSRFGYLSYGTTAAPMFALRSATAEQFYEDLPNFSTSESTRRIPLQVAEVGSVELTAIIHSMTARVVVWEIYLPLLMAKSSDEAPRRWPAETGGDETLRKILEVCERRRLHPRKLTTEGIFPPGSDPNAEIDELTWSEIDPEIDPELKALMLPERQRLKNNMKEAIHRMLNLLYDFSLT